ncbi:MAG: DAK2 domain-containing protein [Clostridia bacterium]
MSNITGEIYRKMIIEGALSIDDVKDITNELNVFPVPDGDTGTNMALTMSAGLKAMSELSTPSLKDAVDKTASALLRGARGNSGVILSLLFRGFSKYLKELDEVNGRDFAYSLNSGVETAYSAVMKPAEGTILTVSRVSAQSAVDSAEINPDITVSEIFDVLIESANNALKETQFQNPVLEKAGVIDAGAYGYIEILKGMQNAYLGKELIREAKPETLTSSSQANFSEINTDDIKFMYCTEFIASKEDPRRSVSKLKSILDSIGDSIVVVDDDEIVKVHVHTNEPNIALGEGLKFGPLLSIKIENMKEQHSTKVVEEASVYTPVMEIAPNDKPVGFVSVSAGDGLADVFSDLGVDTVVRGGQTMNPSTDDIVRAINSVPAETVFVLPNNKNIIMAAEQAIDICKTKKVIVIPSKTIPQGITAMLNFDEGMDIETITSTMNDSLSLVKSGQITYAARNSDFDGKKIKEGEYLGLFESKLNSNHKKLDNVVTKLVKEMITADNQFATIIYGSETTEEEAQTLVSIFEKQNPNIEITLINGGQPVYYYIISVE